MSTTSATRRRKKLDVQKQRAAERKAHAIRNRKRRAIEEIEKNPVGKYVLNRMPQTDVELYWFMQAVFGLRVPAQRVCPNHTTPFRAFADAFFARVPVTVWKASRGFGGKTATLSGLVIAEAVCLGSEASILGGSSAQSLNVHNASKTYWGHHHAPRDLLAQDPTKYDTFLTNGAHIRSLMASQASVRGPHPQRLRLDEIDEMDMEILTSAQGQPMRKRNRSGEMVETQTVMSSTHQYPDATMTQILRRAAEFDWPVYQWCWRETSNPVDGWLTPDEIERKRKEVPAKMWETEYDLQEPSFEGRAFDTHAVDAAFDPAIGAGNDDTWELGLPIVDRNAYITGIDWAQKHDWTEIITFDTRDTTQWLCTAIHRCRREPWRAMIMKAIRRFNKYTGYMAHDATGIGNVVSDVVQEELTMSQIRNFRDYIMSGGRDRADMFSDYIAAIESGKIKFPRIDWLYEEHKYCALEDLFGRGHPPDGVVACAIAWRHRSLANRLMAPPTGISRAASPWDLSTHQRN